MGTGGIAATMRETLAAMGARVVAVGSASQQAADRFAAEHGIAAALAPHARVAEHPDVDVVYVATTNDLHYANTLDAIAYGKTVLCEKPLALNAAQAREMLGAGRGAGVLVMEAMWTALLPFVATIGELIASGTIGTVRHVHATLGFTGPRDPQRRWINRDLGGGALLDLGVYPLSLIQLVLGPPDDYATTARLASTGVDVDVQVVARHGDAGSSVTCSFGSDLPNEAVITGKEGRIRVHSPFHDSRRLTVERGADVAAIHDTGYEGHGFRFQVAEVERCVGAGLVESPRRPHTATLEVMEWMDGIRAQVGVVYPGE